MEGIEKLGLIFYSNLWDFKISSFSMSISKWLLAKVLSQLFQFNSVWFEIWVSLFLCGLLFKLCWLKNVNRSWSIQLGLSECQFLQVVRLVKALPSLVSTRLRQALLRFNTVRCEVDKLLTLLCGLLSQAFFKRFDWVSLNFCLSFLCGLADQKRQLLWYYSWKSVWYSNFIVRANLLVVAFSFYFWTFCEKNAGISL